MDDNTLQLVKSMVDMSISNYFWWFVIAGAALFCKNMIENIVTGLMFLWGKDYNVDDEVYLNGKKKARIVRQTLGKTTFYIYEGNRRLVVPNKMLPSMQIEVALKTEQILE